MSSPFKSTGEAFAQRGRAPQFPQRRALRIKKQPNPFARGGSVPGYFLGGLFDSSPGTSTTTQNSTTTSGVIDPNYNTLMDNVLGRANTLLNTSQFKSYVGPNGETNPMVGLTPEQQRGITAAGQNVGSYKPFFGQASGAINGAQGAYNPTAGQPYVTQAGQMQNGTGAASPFINQASQTFPGAVQQYMSPYTSNVVQGIQDASNRNFEQNTMKTINDTFSGGNAAQFGREQHGNTVGNAVFAKTQADDAAVSNALESGYSTAGNLFNQDQNRTLQAGQTAGTLAQGDISQRAGLGQTEASIQGANTNAGTTLGQAQTGLGAATQQGGINDVNALEQVGAVGQNTNQQQSNFNYNQFQQQQQYPWQVAQAAQGLGQGWQLPTQSNTQSVGTSTVQQPQGSPFGQILGGALGAASLATPGASGTSALGNIFNGIKGWFADGGYVPHLAVGGMVPTVGAMRKHGQRMNLRGMQPTGMPGMPPMAGPPPAVAPQPNGQIPQRGQRVPYARGGSVSPFAQDGDYDDDQVPNPMASRFPPPIPPAPLMRMPSMGGSGGGQRQQSQGGGMNFDPTEMFKLLGDPGNILGEGDGTAMAGFPGIGDMFGGLGGDIMGGAAAGEGAGALMDFLPLLAAKKGGRVPGYDDGGMFLNASEGLDDRMASEDPRLEMMRRPSPFTTPDSDMGPTGSEREFREDPLAAMWRRVPPHIRTMLAEGRGWMPDKALEGYANAARDMGRGMMSGDPMEALSSGAESGMNMMGVMAPGYGRAAERAFNPFLRRMLAGSR